MKVINFEASSEATATTDRANTPAASAPTPVEASSLNPQAYRVTEATHLYIQALKHIEQANDLCLQANQADYGDYCDEKTNDICGAFEAVQRQWRSLVSAAILMHLSESKFTEV